MKLYEMKSYISVGSILIEYLNSVGFRQSYELVEVLEYKSGVDWQILVRKLH